MKREKIPHCGGQWRSEEDHRKGHHVMTRLAEMFFPPRFFSVIFSPSCDSEYYCVRSKETNDYSFGSLLQKPTHSLMNPPRLPLFIFYTRAASLWRKKQNRTKKVQNTLWKYDGYFFERLQMLAVCSTSHHREKARTVHNMCFNLSFFLCTNKAC